MKLWPRSLFGRTALLVAGIVVLSQVVSAVLLYSIYMGTRLERMAAMVATEFKTIGHALEIMPRAERAQYVVALRVNQDIDFRPGAATPGVPTPARFAARRFERFLGAQFAQPVTIRWQRARLWLAWPPADSATQAQIWIGLPFAPLERDLWRVAFVWLGLGGALGLLGALWIARRINRPLRTLTHAAAQLGRGDTPHDLPERGPSEIAALSRTFNQMARDVQRLTAERTLLLAGVSHDLRTPLARLRLALEMLGDKSEAALTEGMVQDVDDMDRIVEQFLAYVRDGEMETVRPSDLNELIHASAARYRRQGHALTLDLTPLPPLALRVTAMQRLLSNLIDNALRHGGGNVEVRTRLLDTHVVLSVLDRGPGLAQQNMRASRQGFGLGLVVVERIAQLHRGALQLRAREGGGVEARVELPLTASAR